MKTIQEVPSGCHRNRSCQVVIETTTPRTGRRSTYFTLRTQICSWPEATRPETDTHLHSLFIRVNIPYVLIGPLTLFSSSSAGSWQTPMFTRNMIVWLHSIYSVFLCCTVFRIDSFFQMQTMCVHLHTDRPVRSLLVSVQKPKQLKATLSSHVCNFYYS